MKVMIEKNVLLFGTVVGYILFTLGLSFVTWTLNDAWKSQIELMILTLVLLIVIIRLWSGYKPTEIWLLYAFPVTVILISFGFLIVWYSYQLIFETPSDSIVVIGIPALLAILLNLGTITTALWLRFRSNHSSQPKFG